VRASPRPVEAKRVVVRLPNWLGDVVMSTPGLRALREAWPDARLVVQVRAGLAPLLEGSGLCDEIWPLPLEEGGGRGGRADVRRLASGHFDLGIVIPESVSSALLMRLGRVQRVVGFARDPIRRWLLHDEAPAPAAWGRRRLVSRERFVLMLASHVIGRTIDPTPAALRLSLGVTDDEEARLEAALRAAGTSSEVLRQSPPVVIAPGASFGPAKCWPANAYAALADRLIERGESVVLLGGPGEAERVEAVREAMKRDARVLAGTLDVGALKALLRDTRLLVANDAGTRHVAAAFSVPSVVFFGPTSVAKTADHLDRVTVLESEHACRPCYRRRCPIDHRCLRSIGVEEAWQASAAALDRARDASCRPGRP
jgi:heptosyltransferase-2